LHAHLLWQQGRRQGLLEHLVLDELVSAGEVAVDVGANFGQFARRLARQVGRRGHVYVFEPHPEHLGGLRRLSKRPNVSFLPLALSDHAGTAQLQVPQIDGAGVASMASLEKGLSPGKGFDGAFEAVSVQVETFEGALADEPRRVDFVKCDVEGHELAFLHGASGRLARDHPALLLEVEQRHQTRDISETFALLEEAGYDGWVVGPDGLAPHQTFDVERDQLAILRSLPPAAPVGVDYLNTFLFVSRHRALPAMLQAGSPWLKPVAGPSFEGGAAPRAI